ncbi:MAG: low molecular weight phosphotyrosine protein phosphatase [Saprospiraceae bacterium]|nr:low molecular weight phosphotyrosine protein phosphatase [Saprospiraceae bacterium]MCF8250052.1 low molecular weight phosphotyrosine protein phosphatase [Saprospiraceae bacterium]MCF8279514.1 low molecular weight phosphotyrosine protein phosphatase [Bacteroidales bacterium]MCF8311982.1 low molecular weight phosphotyrosine protein phosphatase [Saprospiraceae bacterium]MCF8440328.1 low molecular weight phosphotyrosine protein phosphatase [Saprospiraceae bacterium]
MKILMVCLGNICRSPLAEGIMQHKITASGLDWQVDSAGTGAWHVGEQPDSRSIATARQHGIDITRQRARQLKPHDLDRFDLVLAMDSQNYRDILGLATTKAQEDKVLLIMNFVAPDRNQAVPDPYWNDNGFEQVFEMLEAACGMVVEKFKVGV